MKKTLATVLALATLTGATASYAQQQELSMLEQSVTNQFQALGIDASMEMLTVGQLAQISSILNSDVNESEKKSRIERIVNPGGSFGAQQGASMLQLAVANQFQALGIDADTDDLTLSQLSLVASVLNSDVNDSEKTRRIETIVGTADAATAAGVMEEGVSMLELAVTNQFQALGIDADMRRLSVSQLAQISAVLNSDVNEAEKKTRIETIIGS